MMVNRCRQPQLCSDEIRGGDLHSASLVLSRNPSVAFQSVWVLPLFDSFYSRMTVAAFYNPMAPPPPPPPFLFFFFFFLSTWETRLVCQRKRKRPPQDSRIDRRARSAGHQANFVLIGLRSELDSAFIGHRSDIGDALEGDVS